MPHDDPTFPANGLKFLSTLARQNTTLFFHTNRSEYEEVVRSPMIALVEAVNRRLARTAPRYVATLPRCVSRPNRDTRFSRDKSPYHTFISAVFPCDGIERQKAAGFYFRIHSAGVDLVGGSVVPGPEELGRIRHYIARHADAVQSTVSAVQGARVLGELQGDALLRVPKPWAPGHPAADLLKRKQFFFESTLPRTVVTSPRLANEIATRFQLMLPVVKMLDTALGNG